jgi:hypothetical protein
MTHDADQPQAEAPPTDAAQNDAPPSDALRTDTPPTDDPRVEPLGSTAPRPSAPPRVEATHPSRRNAVGLALLNALERLLKSAAASQLRPKVRLVTVGVILIIIGGWFINHSVWTFPLVIIGVVMIMVAWVGSRLEGRFGIEWNEDGAGFEMQARFKARAPALPPPAASSAYAGPHNARSGAADAGDDTVIEGEAHTIEIDVEELRALIEAAERGTMTSATAEGTHVSWQSPSSGVDRGVNGAGG